jgi:hypothetical protein
MLLLIPQPVSPWPRSSATATPGGTREKYMSSLLSCQENKRPVKGILRLWSYGDSNP